MRQPSHLTTWTVILVLGVSVRWATAAEHATPPKKPNILFLFTDDQRWDTIHALGNPDIQTPNLDKLVEQGFTFNNCYCQGSWSGAVCLPSRTMVLTGQSVWRIPRARNAQQVGPEVCARTLPAVLKRAGYVTMRSGKGGNTCNYALAEFDQNTNDGDDRRPNSSKAHADRAIKFLESHDGNRPFFIQLSFDKPHDPRRAPPELMQMYDRNTLPLPASFMPQHPFDNGELYIRDELLAAFPRTEEEMRQHLGDYYACVTEIDIQVGRILEALAARGFAENTYVVFSSDHGLAVGGAHGLMGKQNLYESNKPPLLFTGPSVPHGKSDALVYLYDLYATFCDMAGADAPKAMEGASLMPIVRGEKPKVRDYLYGAYRSGQRMVRDDRWKLIKYHVAGKKHVQLFDLKTDPDELHNLATASEAAEHLARLSTLLDKANREYADPEDFEGKGTPASKVWQGRSRSKLKKPHQAKPKAQK